jgi:integrase
MAKLTEKLIRNIQATNKAQLIADENGLSLWVAANTGAKYWRLRYTKDGKQNMLSLGIWNPDKPDKHVTLIEARDKAFEARKLLKNGHHPSRQENNLYKDIVITSFEEIAREFVKIHAKRCAPGYERYTIKRLEQHILPHMGNMAINQIKAPFLLNVFRKMEARGVYELTHRCKEISGQIFRYGIVKGVCERDPTADLKGALISVRATKQPAIIEEQDFIKLMRDIRLYDGALITRLALELLAHVFLRTSELRLAKWNEFNFIKKLWTIPRERMKIKEDDFLVPLTEQSITILEKIKEINFDSEYVFAHINPYKPISEQTMIYALYRMGYKGRHCCHGFRSTASTILNEQREYGMHNFSAELIEFSLSHKDSDEVRAAYNRSKYILPRFALYTYWSEYINSLI